MKGNRKEPTVSVIVPSYNKPEYLVACLQSVQAQTFEDWVCIVVSDGSPRIEEIRAAVEGMRDPRFRLVEQKENLGLAAARNTGARHSRGDWLAFLDEDDLFDKHYLEKGLQAASVSACDAVVIGGASFGDEYQPLRCELPSLDRIKMGMTSIGTALVVRREIFWAVGGYDEAVDLRVCEDHEFYIRLCAARIRWGTVYEPLYFVRRLANVKSLQRDYPEQVIIAKKYIIQKHKYLYSTNEANALLQKCHLGTARRYLDRQKRMRALRHIGNAACYGYNAKIVRMAAEAFFGRTGREWIGKMVRTMMRAGGIFKQL